MTYCRKRALPVTISSSHQMNVSYSDISSRSRLESLILGGLDEFVLPVGDVEGAHANPFLLG